MIIAKGVHQVRVNEREVKEESEEDVKDGASTRCEIEALSNRDVTTLLDPVNASSLFLVISHFIYFSRNLSGIR